MTEDGGSTEFVDFWNEVLAPKFIRYRHILVDGLSGHSQAVESHWGIEPGHHVLDVGCGFGDTAIRMAELTGPDGRVLGIDCCQAFLDLADQDAQEAGFDHLEFRFADAQSCEWSGLHDLCFSRFGTMFFDNPVAALRNIRRSLKPDGRLMMIVWRSLEDNPWFKMPRDLVYEFLPPPGDKARSCGPGPFSMADEEMVTRQLEIAGFDSIGFEQVDVDVTVGRDVEEAIDFQLALGPAGEAYREAGEEAERQADNIRTAMTGKLQEFLTPEGVKMKSSSWCITARNPETQPEVEY